MPVSYKCPKGGKHQWVSLKTADGVSYKKCKKCGQSRPS